MQTFLIKSKFFLYSFFILLNITKIFTADINTEFLRPRRNTIGETPIKGLLRTPFKSAAEMFIGSSIKNKPEAVISSPSGFTYDPIVEIQELTPGPATKQKAQDLKRLTEAGKKLLNLESKSEKTEALQPRSLSKEFNRINILRSPAIRHKAKTIDSSKDSLNLSINFDPKFISLTEALNFLIESYRISNLGSTDKLEILLSAKLGQIQHALSFIWAMPKAYNSFNDYEQVKSLDKKIGLAMLADLLPNLIAINFFKKDREIFKNVKPIAQYNKLNKRSLFKEKFIQYSWLTVNKLLPLAYFVYSRKTNDNITNLDIFNEKTIINNNSLSKYYLFNVLGNLSEIIRKHYRYKAEMGEYEALLKE